MTVHVFLNYSKNIFLLFIWLNFNHVFKVFQFLFYAFLLWRIYIAYIWAYITFTFICNMSCKIILLKILKMNLKNYIHLVLWQNNFVKISRQNNRSFRVVEIHLYSEKMRCERDWQLFGNKVIKRFPPTEHPN